MSSRGSARRLLGILALVGLVGLTACPAAAQPAGQQPIDAVTAGKGGDVPPSGYGGAWSKAAKPVAEVWAAPGELQIDPMTGKTFNPFVKDRDWAKTSTIWSAADKQVKLAAARNEWLGFQVLIGAKGEDLRNVTVALTDLTGPDGAKIRAGQCQLFRMWYTEVTEPSRSFDWVGGFRGFNGIGVPSLGLGWYGDCLVPFHVPFWGGRFAVAKDRCQSVWVDIKTPKGLPAGQYAGRVTVTAERAEKVELNVELTVWDFDVPDALSARAEAPMYRGTLPGYFRTPERSELGLKLERDFFRMARAHRMSAYIYDTYPDLKGPNDTEKIDIDWTFYDKRYAGYLDGTAFDDKLPHEQWHIAFDTNWPSPRGWAGDKDKSALYYARMANAIKAYDDHFKEKGWDPKTMYVFFQGLDEPGPEKFQAIRRVAAAVHKGSNRIKVRHDFYTVMEKAEEVIRIFENDIDIWCISGCFYDVKALQAQQAKGKQAWFYQGSEPWIGSEDIDNDALGMRTWAWIGWKYRVDCWHNWCSGRWGSENILTTPNNGGSRQAWRPNSNGVMIYPGKPLGVDELFPSVRLKSYRRGNTDYEYFVLLKELGGGDKADRIVGSIIRKALGEAGTERKLIGQFGNWSHDPDEWEKARAALAEEILKAKAAKKDRQGS